MKSNIKSIDNQTARKRLNIISITFAFNTLAGSIVFPFLPIYLHTIRRIPMSTVGLIFPVMGLYGLVQGIGWSMGPLLGSQLFEAYAGRPVTLWAMLSFSALIAGIGFLWIGVNKLPH